MLRKMRIYQFLTFAFMFVSIILLLIVGITAVQKSMTLNLKFNVAPSFEIIIKYDNDIIFSNTTKGDNKSLEIGQGYTLSGNNLTFNQGCFSLGESFELELYNFSLKNVKVSVIGNGVVGEPIALPSYA
ncbi:MAG: hypothetical protein IKT27_04905, partial [Clostridia bacterium]|nr:hypothetical protein [Clostridia bacterium]